MKNDWIKRDHIQEALGKVEVHRHNGHWVADMEEVENTLLAIPSSNPIHRLGDWVSSAIDRIDAFMEADIPSPFEPYFERLHYKLSKGKHARRRKCGKIKF